LHNLSLRRPRTFLVVVKHNAIKNPEMYFIENHQLGFLTLLRLFEIFVSFV